MSSGGMRNLPASCGSCRKGVLIATLMSRFPKALAEAVRRARASSGLIDKALAETLGVHPGTVSVWKNARGTKPIGLSLLRKLCALAEMTPEELSAIDVLWAIDKLQRDPVGGAYVELYEELSAGGHLSEPRLRDLKAGLVELALSRAKDQGDR